MKDMPDSMIEKRIQIAGFTLLEIMVAVSIIAIVFISVFKMHTQTISMSSDVRFYTTAPLLAQSKLTEYELKSVDDLSDDSGGFGEEYPGYSWQVSVNDVDSEVLEDTAKDLKRIDVSVSFNEENAYQLRSYWFFMK